MNLAHRRSAGRCRAARATGRVAGALAAVLAVTAGVSVQAGAASTPGTAGTATIGHAPQIPAGATALGPLSSTTSVHFDVILAPRDQAALDRFVAAVSDPTSPDYGHYLPKGAFGRQYGASPATVAAVRAALAAGGLSVGPVSSDGLVVPVSGSAGRVSAALSLRFERYRLAGGRVAYANRSAPSLPAAAGRGVAGIAGLSDIAKAVPELARAADPASSTAPGATASAAPGSATGAAVPAATGAQACTAATTVATDGNDYTWTALAKAYGFTSAYADGDLGAGETVALFELAQYLPADITAFESCFSLPSGSYGSVTPVPVDGGATTLTTGQIEAVLDIEDVLGFAPEATVLVYSAPNTTTGLVDEYQRIVTTDVASVVSTSWGECELEESTSDPTTTVAENLLFEQAAAQGQSVFAAAGDSGSTDCFESQEKYKTRTHPTYTTRLSADDPASEPYVTGVGGTEMTDDRATDPTETVWHSKTHEGGGGGVSRWWAKPAWQSTGRPTATVPLPPAVTGTRCSTAPKAATAASACRQVPDVAANADPTRGGDVIYCTGATLHTRTRTKYCNSGWVPIGGTSDAAPLWAALATVADESCGTAVGFADPKLYALGASDQDSYFNDITTGNNATSSTATYAGLYTAKAGYDDASGWGTPHVPALMAALCQNVPVGVTVAPTSGQVGDDTSATVSFTTSQSGSLGDTATISISAAGSTFTWPTSPADYQVSDVGSVSVAGAGSAASPLILTLHTSTIGAKSVATIHVSGIRFPTVAGTFSINVHTSSDELAATSNMVAAVAGPPSASKSSITASATSVDVGTTVTVTVTDRDGFGNPESARTVTLRASGAGAVVTPPSTTTSAGGVATFSLTDSTPVAVALSATETGTVVDGPTVTFSRVTSGYDMVGADGGVFVFPPPGGTGGFYGSLPKLGVVPAKPVVGMVPTVDDQGYFLVASDGGVFSFGNAPYLGSLPGLAVTPAAPITGIVAADTDAGYFLVGRDGGVYAFGRVPFLGSLPGEGISVDNIIGIAATPSGNGYWLVSATGTVYAFGAATKIGTEKGSPSPVSAIAGTPTGKGYWITTDDGAVYAFGAARKPTPGTLPAIAVTPSLPVVAVVPTRGTGGYWLIGSDGGIFAFGDASYVGSLPGLGVNVTDIVGAVPIQA